MKRIPALVIAVALAVAVIAGTFAALRTTQLGAGTTSTVSAAELQKRTRALNRADAALRREARRKPPALPALPALARASAQRRPQSVIYVRPKPIVHVVHRGGEHENEHEGHDAGAELDD